MRQDSFGRECLVSGRDNGGDGAKLLTVVEGGRINDNRHEVKERLTQGKTVFCSYIFPPMSIAELQSRTLDQRPARYLPT